MQSSPASGFTNAPEQMKHSANTNTAKPTAMQMWTIFRSLSENGSGFPVRMLRSKITKRAMHASPASSHRNSSDCPKRTAKPMPK